MVEDVGGNPGYGCDGTGSDNAICDCLSCALESIATSTASIASTLERKLGTVCDHLDECMDKIIDKLKQRIEGPLYSCQECKSLIARGMGGTLEYAVRCSANVCNDCDTDCGAGENTDGACCKTCGKPNCKCKQGQCVPVEEGETKPPPKQKKYFGWCNKELGIVGVTKEGEEGLGPGWERVTFADTEIAAMAEAEQVCGKFVEKAELESLPLNKTNSPLCNLYDYVNGQSWVDMQPKQVAANFAQGITRTLTSIGSLGLEGINFRNVGEALSGIYQASVSSPAYFAEALTPFLATAIGCNSPEFRDSLMAVAAISQTANFIGMDVSQWLTPYTNTMNAACRQRFLDPDKAVAAYLANSISGESLDAHWAIAGLCNSSMNEYVKASRAKPVPLQLAIMRRRRIIDAETYNSKMRELGYLERPVVDDLFKITEQVPTMAEIIRFMVRDTDDTRLVNKFKLDEGFTEKYGAQLKQWSEDQGVTELAARYNWRAHWTIPSPTQLFTFWHRLRYNPKFGTKEEQLQDIKDAMIQQDILPYWHERYLAVSFRPMRLIDIRRSFEIGTLKDNELVAQFIDLGYSDETAERMAAFTRRLRDRGVVRSLPIRQWVKFALNRTDATNKLLADGIPQDVIDRAFSDAMPELVRSPYALAFVRGDISRTEFVGKLTNWGCSPNIASDIADQLALKRKDHPAIEELAVGTITATEANETMISDGMNPSVVSKIVVNVLKAVELSLVKQCQVAIRQKFVLGEVTQQEARTELESRKTTAERAMMLVNWWGCQLKSGEKQVSANTLCGWLASGAITSTDFADRLRRLGYNDTDVALMVDDCLASISIKRANQAKKEAKEHAAEQQRTSRLLRQQAQQEARFLAQSEAARKKAAKTKANREKQSMDAAEKLAAKCECGFHAAFSTVRQLLKRLQTEYALSIDRSLQVAITAAEEYDGSSLDAYVDTAIDAAQGLIELAVSGVESQEPPQSSSNGSTQPL